MSAVRRFQGLPINKFCAVRGCLVDPGPGMLRRCRATDCFDSYRWLCPDHRFSENTCIACVGEDFQAVDIPCAVYGCNAEQQHVVRICKNGDCPSVGRFLCIDHCGTNFDCFFCSSKKPLVTHGPDSEEEPVQAPVLQRRPPPPTPAHPAPTTRQTRSSGKSKATPSTTPALTGAKSVAAGPLTAKTDAQARLPPFTPSASQQQQPPPPSRHPNSGATPSAPAGRRSSLMPMARANASASPIVAKARKRPALDENDASSPRNQVHSCSSL